MNVTHHCLIQAQRQMYLDDSSTDVISVLQLNLWLISALGVLSIRVLATTSVVPKRRMTILCQQLNKYQVIENILCTKWQTFN